MFWKNFYPPPDPLGVVVLFIGVTPDGFYKAAVRGVIGGFTVESRLAVLSDAIETRLTGAPVLATGASTFSGSLSEMGYPFCWFFS